MKRCRSWSQAVLIALAATLQTARTEEPAAEPASRLRKAVETSADVYRVCEGEELERPLERKIILAWNNSVRQTGNLSEGCTSVWVRDGIPLAIACSYTWNEQLKDNLQSLSQQPMSAEKDGQIVWQCNSPGIAYQTLPGEKPPAASSAVRLRQMKALAERFSAKLLGWNSDDSDRETLRMLSRHVFRYEPSKDGELLDGAMFEFTQGTDPECVLLLEAVAAKDGKPPSWRYALVRQTAGGLTAEFDGKPVWQADKDYSDGGFDQPRHQLNRPLEATSDVQ
jgi:hypothetical protein